MPIPESSTFMIVFVLLSSLQTDTVIEPWSFVYLKALERILNKILSSIFTSNQTFKAGSFESTRNEIFFLIAISVKALVISVMKSVMLFSLAFNFIFASSIFRKSISWFTSLNKRMAFFFIISSELFTE